MAKLLILKIPSWLGAVSVSTRELNTISKFILFRCLRYLPRWTCVAIAVRSSLRIENLIIGSEEGSEAFKHKKNISSIIELTRKATLLGRFEGDINSYSTPKAAGIAAAPYLPHLGSVFRDACCSVGYGIYAAGFADSTIAWNFDSIVLNTDNETRIKFQVNNLSIIYVARSINSSLNAARRALGFCAMIKLTFEILSDIGTVLSKRKLCNLSNDSRIPDNFFGSLWNSKPINISKVRKGFNLEENEKNKLSYGETDIIVWRYMKVNRFQEMIKTGKLHFTRADKFKDTYEGFLPRGKHIPFPSSVIEQFRREVLVNCWHISVDESIEMWRRYADEGKGIAIQSTLLLVKKSFFPDTQTVYDAFFKKMPNGESGFDRIKWVDCEKVKYVDFETHNLKGKNILEHFFIKRKCFEDEKELRLVYHISQTNIYEEGAPKYEPSFEHGLDLPCNLKMLILRVVVGPNISDISIRFIKDLCLQYGLNLPIIRSKFHIK